MLAIGKILDRLKLVAVKELGVEEVEKIAIAHEKVFYCGQPTDLTWEKLVFKASQSRTDLSAHGFYTTPGLEFDRTKEKGHPFAYHICGTAIVETTLDCLRGIYQIDAVKIVHDLGRSVNKLVDIGPSMKKVNYYLRIWRLIRYLISTLYQRK